MNSNFIETLPPEIGDLPIAEKLGEICQQLSPTRYLVIEAAPGAGKTTAIPIALAKSQIFDKKILMLEPRRAATRNAALRIAALTNTKLGEFVGHRMRGDSVITNSTKIEIVTDGILTRLLQDDPSLDAYGAIIFDEFHERHLNSDLSLALVIESAEALREDLRVIVMSATLDAAPIAALLDDAPIITSTTRQFPIECFWSEHNLRTDTRDLPAFIARETLSIMEPYAGSALVFLPGKSEIERTAKALGAPQGILVETLYGQMPYAAQKAVIERSDGARRIVLTSPIAESAITLSDIKIVIDSGLVRRPEFDPHSGMGRLVTKRISKAEATQRAGRAGRLSEGIALKLWRKSEEGIMAAYPPADILHADLTPMALTLADWGNPDANGLKLLTPPPKLHYQYAQSVLTELGAAGALGITPWGKRLATSGLHPRLASIFEYAQDYKMMVVDAHDFPMKQALPRLIALLEDVLSTPVNITDFEALFYDLLREKRAPSLHDARYHRIIDQAKRYRLRESATTQSISLASLLARGFPERIAALRSEKSGDYLLANGQGARLEHMNPPSFLVAPLLYGDRQDARIELFVRLSRDEIFETFPQNVDNDELVEYLRTEARIAGFDVQKYRNIILKSAPKKLDANDALLRAQVEMIKSLGISALDWSKAARALQTRAKLARTKRPFPDLCDEGLLENAPDWLAAYGTDLTKKSHLNALSALELLRGRLTYEEQKWLDDHLPERLTLPNGRTAHVNYDQEAPLAQILLTDAYGLHETPKLADVPLRLELLSPARRPVQTTSDLAGFWNNSYPEIRKEMRGRYPKHHWPENPMETMPREPRKRNS